MSDDKPETSFTNAVVISAVFGAIGLWMILSPGASEGADVSGRRSGLKRLITWLWGMPFGIFMLILSALMFYGA